MDELDATNIDAIGAEPGAPPDRDSLVRALRELQASEARVKRNADRVYDDARGKLVMELLPVLDNIDRTLLAPRGRQDPLVEGVRMVRGQLEGVLLRYGVERIDATGERFDPAVHEAVATVVDPQRVGMVIQQLEPGYRFGARLLRAAKVTVGVAPRG